MKNIFQKTLKLAALEGQIDLSEPYKDCILTIQSFPLKNTPIALRLVAQDDTDCFAYKLFSMEEFLAFRPDEFRRWVDTLRNQVRGRAVAKPYWQGRWENTVFNVVEQDGVFHVIGHTDEECKTFHSVFDLLACLEELTRQNSVFRFASISRQKAENVVL